MRMDNLKNISDETLLTELNYGIRKLTDKMVSLENQNQRLEIATFRLSIVAVILTIIQVLIIVMPLLVG